MVQESAVAGSALRARPRVRPATRRARGAEAMFLEVAVDNDANSTSKIYLDGHGDLVIQANESNGKWTSGRIETTRDDFMAPPGGRMEMTASIEQLDVANGTGYWPAFWALGAPGRTGTPWPQAGELDMFEDVNGDDKASQTLHADGLSEAHPLISCPIATCQTAFNTYSVIVDRTDPDAEFVEFLMDGQVGGLAAELRQYAVS